MTATRRKPLPKGIWTCCAESCWRNVKRLLQRARKVFIKDKTAGMSGSLIMMKLTGYTDPNFRQRFNVTPNPYLVTINPETIKWTRSIVYNEQQAPDKSSASQKYAKTPSEKLSFDIILDGTGIVNNKRTDLMTEINNLKKIVFSYNGAIHRPNFVTIQWGKSISFNGVLTSFDTSFTLFRPDGSPLRAKLSLAFSMYISPANVTKKDAPKSPDITHIEQVADGVNLPQMCHKVWHNDKYYVQVAKYNGLNHIRNLQGVKQVIFPPIIQPS